MFRVLPLALAAALLASMSATSAPAATFRIAIGIDPDTLDPIGTTTTTAGNVVDYVAETLTRLEPSGDVVPHLAESWTISPDGREYTFKLRRGVVFHDGTPFDARAVKWNLDRVADPNVKVPIRNPYPIEKTEVVDSHTVKVTLKHPFAPFISGLSWTTAAMVSPEGVKKPGNDYGNYQNLVGTGPYTLGERRRGESITLNAFPKYWGRKPYYDTVVVRIVPEAATRESLILAGQVDLMILPPIADIPALQRNPAVKVLLAPSDRSIFIAINTNKIKDRRVRQAINYAVDKSAIIKNVLFDAADVMDGPMAPSLFGYCKVGEYAFDPQRAKQLLKEAGVPQGTRIQLMHPTGRYVQDREAAQAIAGYLREVGLDAQLTTTDWPTYIKTIMAPPESNTTEMHLLGWAPAFLDASQQMAQFTSANHPPKALATSFYRNPEVDRLAAQAEQETNPEKRKDLYCQVSKLIWEDAPWLFLWVQRFPVVYSAKVTNVEALPNEKFWALYARPAQ
ncbi:MAG TPA: ABC transporter substrate-binding protein [Thermodesulfobacteriota bacterium]